MLEQKDLEAIGLLLDSKLEKNNGHLKKYIQEEIKKSETFLLEKMECMTRNSEEFLLEEMERMHSSTNEKILFLQKNIDELTQYNRITKLENDNTALLLQMISRLQEDVEELKRKIA